MRLDKGVQPVGDSASELFRLERDRTTVLAKDPAGEEIDIREVRLEDPVLDRSSVRKRALHPPGRVIGHRDSRSADRLADLPGSRHAVLLDVEFRRHAKVALAPGGEANVPADAGDLERSHGVTVEVVPDHVPVAVVQAERVGIHDAFPGARAPWAPVSETDRALLRDR